MGLEVLASIAVFLFVMGVLVYAMTPESRLPRVSWTAGRPVHGMPDELVPHRR